MKGLSETMIIVITVVIVLIAALVLLSVFSNTITPTGERLKCQSLCAAQLPSCGINNLKAGDSVPGWNTGDSKGCTAIGIDCKCS